MNTAVLLGGNSEIGRDLAARLHVDGWTVHSWSRGEPLPAVDSWSLLICAIGTVAPVGPWHEQDADAWDEGVRSNVLLPVRLLRALWSRRAPDAAVCFLAGSNPNKVMAGYSSYNCGKMALLKVVEQLDAESPDARIFALGPGYIKTKIHRPTLEAGWRNEVIERGQIATMQGVYDCLLWCLRQSKEVIGGRNICVSDDWRVKNEHSAGDRLHWRLKREPNLFKLRRCE